MNLEPPMHGSAHDMKLWYYSTVSQKRGEHFSTGEYLLCDPGYISNDKILRVPADEALTKGDVVKKHVADVHRRHRFVVEYSIGAAKSNFPLAGCPGGSTYLKLSHYHGLAWANACALQNFIWDSRGTWLRGEAYFSGQRSRLCSWRNFSCSSKCAYNFVFLPSIPLTQPFRLSNI